MTLAVRKEIPRVLEPGVRIGRKLEVLRRLGEGGMGTLWVARNLTTEAEVAIKVLRPLRPDDRDLHAAERFRHEAKLGAMLTHRNITRVYDLLEDEDGSLVLVMELLRGETLEQAFLARGALSTKEAVAIIVPILGALQHAHEHGVVHRDLKPSNVFLHVDPDGHATPKLLDFGIAKMKDSSVKTQAGNVLGTPSYMSPEQVRASAQLDGRSDVFSVASVLYELVTGENPFRTDSPSATLARVLEVEVDPDPRLEPRVWLEVQRALSKQPYERHPSAAAFAAALCDALGEALPASVRLGPASRSDPKIELEMARAEALTSTIVTAIGLPKPANRRAVVTYAVALLLAVAGVILAYSATRSSKPSVDIARVSRATSGERPAVSAPAAEKLPGVSSASASVAARSTAPSSEAIVARPGAPHSQPKRLAPPPPPSAPHPVGAAASVARTPGF